MKIYVAPPPLGLENEFNELMSSNAVTFVAELYDKFESKVNRLYMERRQKSLQILGNQWRPATGQLMDTESDWRVDNVPHVLRDRSLDLGDVSPANFDHFQAALNADVQGIQVDFDDGHCPSWKNNISGHYNVTMAVHNRLRGVPGIEKSPVLMFRPRAWNMTEHNVIVGGKPIPGPLFDFGLHMYHNGRRLYHLQRGPFFYLSKVESAREAELWDEIFRWTQERLQIPFGTIKATVLIEDILAVFEMEGILKALRHHSAGLNCGIWDYCASIVARFGRDPAFLLPDRNKYVNMDQPFLKNYMELAVQVCRRRNTFATGGMAAMLAENSETIEKVLIAKKKEIETGVVGFMVYDVRLVPHIKKLWKSTFALKNKIDNPITSESLLKVPSGGVTEKGLIHNIRVALLFIYNWQQGRGHYFLSGAVEDSATAEISRWQVYQWLIHKQVVEETNMEVTFKLVESIARNIRHQHGLPSSVSAIYLRLLSKRDPPQFFTTYLSDHYLILEHPAPYEAKL